MSHLKKDMLMGEELSDEAAAAISGGDMELCTRSR